MRISIVGAGAVGFNLARSLSGEGHEVSVVERRPEQLVKLRDRLDVSVVEGSGTSSEVLREAGVEDADLFIAVTEIDEVNMVACTLAHALGKGRRIARIRNKDFSSSVPLVPKRTFGISRIINPDEVTISTLVESILAPGVTDVAEFGEGEILLRGTVLNEDSPFLGVPLMQLRDRHKDVPFLIAAISRDDELLIPVGDTVLEAKDHVFLILRREALPKLQNFISSPTEKVQRVVIFGAGRIGRGLAHQLEHRVENVVLIEPSNEVAQHAAAELDRALVLHGEVTDPAILDSANLKGTDYFVATSDRDEMNIVASALAHRQSNTRVGLVTNEPDFVPALSDLNLDLVINERLITVDEILRFARPGRYLSVKQLNEQGAEIVELSVQKGARADGKKLKDLKLPVGALVVAIRRDGHAELPTGFSEVHSGDAVVLVSNASVREKAARMFFDKRWVSIQEKRR